MVRFIEALCLTFLFLGPSLSQDRVALLVANSAYEHVSRLDNPVNDATDIAAALERIGFDTTLVFEGDGNTMREALHQFSDVAENAEVAIIYYAGHGIEVDRQNYLVPVDAEMASDRDVSFEAIPMDLLTEAVAGASQLRLVLLDACRNNPFAAQMTLTSPTRSIGRGLVAPEVNGGTLIAYAAKGGTVAEDGTGRNSPFAKALLDHIEVPGLEIDFIFRKVRDAVLAETNQRQEPFVYGSLPGEHIYLVPPAMAAVAPVAPAPPTAAIELEPPSEEIVWSVVKNSTDPEVLREFIRAYPRGLHFEAALQRLTDLSHRSDAITPVTIPPAVEVPNRSAEVTRSIQEQLARLGCAPGQADGQWGPRSRAALARFAMASGQDLTGQSPDGGLLSILSSTRGTVCSQETATATAEPAATAVSASLSGTWGVRQTGHAVCKSGQFTLSMGSNSRLTGSLLFSGVPGTIVGGRVSGSEVSFSTSYTDIFGNPETENWVGTLSADRRSIHGSIHGAWANGCRFVATKQ